MVETFVFFGGIIQFELRPQTQIELVDRFNTPNQSFPRQILPGFL